MFAFIIRRLLTMIPLLLVVSLLVSLLMYLAPGDFLTQARAAKDISPEIIAQQERQLGLVNEDGDPTKWFVRYGRWLANVSPVKYGPWIGDDEAGLSFGAPYFGESWTYKVEVLTLLKQRVPATFVLSLTSILFAWSIAIPLGVLAAIYKDSIFDRISALFAYAALSIPEFFLAILAVYFASVTGLFPEGGRSSVESEFYSLGGQVLDYGYHLILPTIVLGLGSVAGMMRVMRANFIDYMRAEFATAARAKGLRERVIMFKHVLRNAINPLITSFGYAFSSLLSGALLVENVMNYPGLGQLIYDALLREDQYVVMAGVIMGVVMLVLGNLLADLLLAWSDPRIRLEGNSNGKSVSSTKGMLVWGILLAILLIEILLESFAPGLLRGIGFVLKYFGILLVAVLALGCVSLVGYIIFTLFRKLFGQVIRRPMGAAALAVLALLYTGALFAPFIAPYPITKQNLSAPYHPPSGFAWKEGSLQVKLYEKAAVGSPEYKEREGVSAPVRFFAKGEAYKLFGCIPMERKLFQIETEDPSARVYLLGSDDTGRDIFSRLLHGSQISLSIGLIGVSITLMMGFFVGSLSGYFGGTFDFVSMRLVELLMSIPGLYLLLALRSALIDPSLSPVQVYLIIVVILAILGWAGTARIIRGMTLSIRNRSFVVAAESMGQSTIKSLVKHILPNVSSYLLVAATLSIPGYILGEAALSFLGLGIVEPSASWGLMLKQSQGNMIVFFMNFWWMLTPGFAIFVTVIAYNVLGDVLRDIVDPKMQGR
ncbi:ABC transporter permease subunit [Coraliomargarita akajimensis]|uniref:Binding-protein-dependent transport systems inner membrane component n=1 Tax=Coraliomargarita akajimensis (strain DSM 45221 / IAM 15411 / JCM 23193 / KCTC 12865 / 04OKA010-24) TaxID=583355 RepID=D5EIG0_CORAD|nr:ABC transporter permease subunit [Coraliomargarita akajimensis]ADE54226.1 binding-protein-dependent transport systems inner membrane component [Coraliomargarita akajimensis DSM 45221]